MTDMTIARFHGFALLPLALALATGAGAGFLAFAWIHFGETIYLTRLATVAMGCF